MRFGFRSWMYSGLMLSCTTDPLWAVVILTTVDLPGFGPTLRKAYAFPQDENIPFFMLFMTINTFELLALKHYSVTTVLFPLAVSLYCLILIIVVSLRRRSTVCN
jgi:hypothetical protein